MTGITCDLQTYFHILFVHPVFTDNVAAQKYLPQSGQKDEMRIIIMAAQLYNNCNLIYIINVNIFKKYIFLLYSLQYYKCLQFHYPKRWTI